MGMILYAPQAHVNMAGSAQVRGSVIARSFGRSGGGNAGIIYVPVSYAIPSDFFQSGSNSVVIGYDAAPWH